MSALTSFVIRQVASLDQLLKGERERSRMRALLLRVRRQLWALDSWEGKLFLIEVFCYHAPVFQVPQNLNCMTYTPKMRPLFNPVPKLLPAVSKPKKTSLITNHSLDSAEAHETSHAHAWSNLKTGLDKQTICLCWHLLLQCFIFEKHSRWKKWLCRTPTEKSCHSS